MSDGRRQTESLWVCQWIHKRRQNGAYHALIKELASEDPQGLRNFITMDKQDFDELLTKISPLIRKKDTNMRKCITPADRLAPVLKTIFHQCVISYTCSQSNSDGSVLKLDWLQVYDMTH